MKPALLLGVAAAGLLIPQPPPLVLAKPAIIRPSDDKKLPLLGLMTAPGIYKPRSAGPVALAYQTQVSNTADLSSYSFASTAIGTASTDRIVVVGITVSAASSGATRSVSSVTIGGISATQLSHVVGATWMTAAIYAAAVPTGTTATIAITMSGTCGRCACAVWAMTGGSITPFDTATDTNASADPNASIDVPANGGAVAAAGSATSTTTTWTGLTERVDTALEGFSTHTVASDVFASAQTGLSVTANFAGAADNSMAMASFSPV